MLVVAKLKKKQREADHIGYKGNKVNCVELCES